jgi:cobalamin synthase
MTKTLLAISALAVIALLTAIGPDSALAQTSDLGRNLGNEIKAWATALLLGVAALVSIPVLAKRDVNGGLTLAFLVLVLGGFAFAQGTVRQVIIEVWRSLQ